MTTPRRKIALFWLGAFLNMIGMAFAARAGALAGHGNPYDPVTIGCVVAGLVFAGLGVGLWRWAK